MRKRKISLPGFSYTLLLLFMILLGLAPITDGADDDQNMQVQSGSVDAMMQVPGDWEPDIEKGTYYDPHTNTTWIFNPFLRKYYAPATGWYLASLFNTRGTPVYQFYFSPKDGVSIDPSTGESIVTNLPVFAQDQVHTPGPSFIPTDNVANGQMPRNYSISGLSDSHQPDGPGPNQGRDQDMDGTNPVPVDTYPSGSGITNPWQPLTDNETGEEESLFEEMPCPLIPCSTCASGAYCSDCNNDGVCDASEPGGLSEEAQETVYHVPKAFGSSSCPIIACSDDQGCLYCQDCNSDGMCESDIPPIIVCSRSKNCSESGYCWDTNYDGICDTPFEES